MNNSGVKLFRCNIGERILTDEELWDYGIMYMSGVVSQDGIFYALSPEIDELSFHEGMANALKKSGNPYMNLYIKYNTSATYFCAAYDHGYTGRLLMPKSSVATLDREEKAHAITPQMAIALYNLYRQFTPTVTSAVVENVEGLGWSNTHRLSSEEITSRNRRTFYLEWDKCFDSSEFRNAIQKFQRYA